MIPYPEEDGGWVGVFYPDKEIRRLRYYSGNTFSQEKK
jgi:hypothetical protein